jgi:hypothetical protein
MTSQSAGSGTELDSLYWTLSIRADQLLAATPGVVQAGKQMEKAGQQVAAAAEAASAATKTQAAAARDAATATASAAKAADAATVSTARHTAAHHELGAGLRATRTGLVQIALQSTQTNAAVGRLVEGMLLLGAGSTAVLGVAAAVSVLAKGYELLTAKSREAAAQLQAVNDLLDKRRTDRAPIAAEQDRLNTELQHQLELEQKLADLQAQRQQIASDPGYQGARGAGIVAGLSQEIAKVTADLGQTAQRIAEAQRGVFSERVTSRVGALDQFNQALTAGTASADDLARRRDVIAQIRDLLAQSNLSVRDRLQLQAALAQATNTELDVAQKHLAVQRQLKDQALAAEEAVAGLTVTLADNALVALKRFDEETQRILADARQGNARPGATPIDVQALAAARARARLGQQGAVVTAQTQDFLRPLQEQLQAAGEATPADQLKILDTLRQEITLRQQQLAQSNAEHVNDQALLAIHTTLLEIAKQRVAVTRQLAQASVDDLNRKAAQTGEQVLATMKRTADQARQASLDLARGIDDAVRAAVQLGEAFGGVDVNLGNVLVGVADLATKLPQVSQQLKDLKSGATDENGNPKATLGGTLSSLAGVVGGAAALISGLGSLFGPSPEEKAYQAELAKNTQAIEALRERIGELGVVNVSGNAAAAAQRAIAGLPSSGSGFADLFIRRSGFPSVDPTRLNSYLATQGTSTTQLNALAQSLGLSVDFTTKYLDQLQDAFRQLGQALQAAQLAQFTQDFTGQFQLLQDSFKAFDITDPLDQLKALQALVSRTDQPGSGGTLPFADELAKLPAGLGQALQDAFGKAFGTTSGGGVGSPALKQALAGNNLDTAEGRAAALANLQALFLRLNLSPAQGGLTPTDLGGLTGQQFEQTLLQLIDLLKQADKGGTGASQSFTATQSITEVTAGRMVSTLLTIATVLQDTLPTLVTQTAQLAAILQAGFGLTPTVTAPPVPTGGYLGTASAAGGSVSVGTLTVQVAAPAVTTDPAAFGAAAGAAAHAALQELNTQLGRDLKLRQVLAGTATIGR